jgi:hypothetical protein
LEGLALKRARICFLILPVFLLLFTACSNAEEETEQQKNTETETEAHTRDSEADQEETTPETAANSEQESSDASNNKGENDTTVEVEAETKQLDSDQQTKVVNSADEAIALLKERLAIKEKDGLIIDPMGGSLEEDEAGAYYTLVTKVKEWVENGGSGTAGIYRVYEDGTIIDQYTEEPVEQTETKVVTSPNDAAELLKEQLNIKDNKDLIVGTAEHSEKDKNGTYYYVTLKSESAMAKGGTGTAGIYRVYENGTIIDAQAEAADREPSGIN